MFDLNAIDSPDLAAKVAGDANPSLTARLAFGIRNAPRAGKTSWLVLELAAGSARSGGTFVLDSLESPETELEVALGIAATEEVWAGSADEAGFLEAVRAQKFFVSGEAPFFIRNLEKLLAVWRDLARM